MVARAPRIASFDSAVESSLRPCLVGALAKAVYLWTLPMFHCNGWCFPWTIAAVAGTHVCLRAVRAAAIYELIAEHGVTHLCGAPIVMSTLLNARRAEKRPVPQYGHLRVAGAPPPEAVLARDEGIGFERDASLRPDRVYGPAVVNEWHPAWDELPAPERPR
jgi:fatty-acyl-CoA synthase